jgi:hypothetical protein
MDFFGGANGNGNGNVLNQKKVKLQVIITFSLLFHYFLITFQQY